MDLDTTTHRYHPPNHTHEPQPPSQPSHTHKPKHAKQEEVLFVLRDILAGATIALVVFSVVGLASALARRCCRRRGAGEEQGGLREPLLLLEEEENVVVIPPDRVPGGARS